MARVGWETIGCRGRGPVPAPCRVHAPRPPGGASESGSGVPNPPRVTATRPHRRPRPRDRSGPAGTRPTMGRCRSARPGRAVPARTPALRQRSRGGRNRRQVGGRLRQEAGGDPPRPWATETRRPNRLRCVRRTSRAAMGVSRAGQNRRAGAPDAPFARLRAGQDRQGHQKTCDDLPKVLHQSLTKNDPPARSVCFDPGAA